VVLRVNISQVGLLVYPIHQITHEKVLVSAPYPVQHLQRLLVPDSAPREAPPTTQIDSGDSNGQAGMDRPMLGEAAVTMAHIATDATVATGDSAAQWQEWALGLSDDLVPAVNP
jgi:hypothetical protein